MFFTHLIALICSDCHESNFRETVGLTVAILEASYSNKREVVVHGIQDNMGEFSNEKDKQ